MGSRKEVDIDVGRVESAKQLHDVLYSTLGLPEYYGANWDAFCDVITAEDVMPERLVLRGWPEFEMRLPREARLMRGCLDDYHTERPGRPCRVVYA